MILSYFFTGVLKYTESRDLPLFLHLVEKKYYLECEWIILGGFCILLADNEKRHRPGMSVPFMMMSYRFLAKQGIIRIRLVIRPFDRIFLHLLHDHLDAFSKLGIMSF